MGVPRWWARRVVLVGGALVLAVLLASAWDWRRTRPDGRLHIVAPALKGDALVLITPNGRTLLIDGSADAVGMTAFVGGRLPFWARSLDALAITRADAGRLPGALAIARRYGVGAALLPTGAGAELDALREALAAERAGIRPLDAGAALLIDGVEITVARPPTRDAGATLLIRYGAFSALLAPSADDAQAAALLAAARPAALLWWPWTRPDDRLLAERIGAAAVIYSQSDSGRAEPRTMFQRGAAERRLLHEEVSGQIEIVTDGAGMWIETER
ncbi:MAG TPA: hypothetical protein VD886_08820 [Herpetosiphonaceae bacterium]|nr:hypothetical protein [Herpetosiphonaceae bacterium]